MKRLLILAALAVMLGGEVKANFITLTAIANSYNQDFDTLSNSVASSTLPTGWLLYETGTNANTTYAVGTGSGASGDTYSYGASSSSERALGSLLSGSLKSRFGVGFTNGGTTAIESFSISYKGEQWRLGATGREDRLNFQYKIVTGTFGTTTFNNDTTWIGFSNLNFSSPVTTGTTGAKDGNSISHRTTISNSLNLLLNPGDKVYFRFEDSDATGADDGLAIDDFAVTANFQAVPEPTSGLLIGLGTLAFVSLRRNRRSA
jgi:hypothetical protein